MSLSNLPRKLARRVFGSTERPLKQRLLAWPPVGTVRFGSLRRLEPISDDFGFERGTPVDRYYIERFLTEHRADLRGAVLEIGEDRYSRSIGGWTGTKTDASRIDSVDVLDVRAANPRATIVADLAEADHVPGEAFDCIVCTQTLMLVYDMNAAIATLHRLLKPGGVLLLTVAGISRLCGIESGEWHDYWRFTSPSLNRLFADSFAGDVEVRGYGNVLAAVASLHGLAMGELRPEELDVHDARYEVILGARALRAL
jgi:SAM-dependent methyltransferase